MIKTIATAATLILSAALSASAQWVRQSVETSASFRGLSVVNEKVIWASGTGGTVIRTIDGGRKWNVIHVPDADKLDFRDIEAFDANTAYILSIGNGAASRIYKTIDGGSTWKEQFRNTDEKTFYDALACWDAKNCLAMSDPVDGKYILVRTTDGESWQPPHSKHFAIALTGETSFAASGTCLIANGVSTAYLISGGTAARVFRSDDRGNTWLAANTPIIKGTAGSGIFSIAMLDAVNGVIVGGNYEKPNEANDNLAFTTDGGTTWKIGSGLSGYRSGVTYIDKRILIAVGTNGSDISNDSGKTWKHLGSEDLNAVASLGKRSVWAVGPKGGVFRLSNMPK